MAHIHEKIDFTASAYVVHGGKVLLRKHEKYGMWLGVGGHIELHEDPVEAVLREVKEEVGLDITLWEGRATCLSSDERTELVPPVGLNRHRISPTHEHVDLIYLATSATDAVVPENETDVWRWCDSGDLKELELEPDVRCYAEFALTTLANK